MTSLSNDRIARARQNQDEILRAMEQAGAAITHPSRNFRCPFKLHEDHNPSAHLYQDAAGVWRFKCHACGLNLDVWDIRARNEGREVADILRENGGNGSHAAPPPPFKEYSGMDAIIRMMGADYIAHYPYVNPDTKQLELLVMRAKGKQGQAKDFPTFKPNGRGGFVAGVPSPRPLFARAQVRAAQDIVVVEGEKDVITLYGYGIVATTSSGGAGKAHLTDWTPLAGKSVTVWPDHDEPGRKHADDVIRLLEQLTPPPAISRLDPAALNLKPKQDVTDFLEQFKAEDKATKEKILREALALAESVGAMAALKHKMEDVISGRCESLKFIHLQTYQYSQPFLPGTVTILCGTPGATKSYFLQEIFMGLHRRGVRVAMLHLEEDRTYYLFRALAHLEDNSMLVNADWIKEHPEKIRAAMDRHEDMLTSFGPCLSETPTQGATYKEILVWAEQKAKVGCRIIAVDPITNAVCDPNKRPWIADHELMAAIKQIAVRHQISFVLVTHPSKQHDSSQMIDRIAGGAAFVRESQTVWWLELHVQPLPNALVLVDNNPMPPPPDKPVNRSLHLVKVRNAPGHGMTIGFFFDAKTLRSHEIGVLAKQAKRPKRKDQEAPAPTSSPSAYRAPYADDDREDKFPF